jgi:hypothetical protein
MLTYLLTVDDTVSVGEIREKIGPTRIFDLRVAVPVTGTTPPPAWHDRIPEGLIPRPWPVVRPFDPNAAPGATVRTQMYTANGTALGIWRSNNMELREKKTLPSGQVLFRVLDAPVTPGGQIWWVRAQDIIPLQPG